MTAGRIADGFREKKRHNSTFDLVSTVHESELSNVKPDVDPDHCFEVVLEPDNFTEEKYKLFENYQRHVHHEGENDVSRHGFKRFLCSDTLHRHDHDGRQTGSFHQMYRLDGRLIAMAVLDLLPQAVSGVYFVYHSDFEKWSFGKLSALREAALAVEEGYGLYYMGYYIHNCKKMRYKGDYRPQHVLDYDTLQWAPMDDEMRALMDRRKWVSLSREQRISTIIERAGQQDPEAFTDAVVAENLYSADYPHPTSAMQSGLSVIDLRVPGAMSLNQLVDEVDLDEIMVTLAEGRIHKMSDLASWNSGSETDPLTIKGIMAELAACIGSKVTQEITVDLAR